MTRKNILLAFLMLTLGFSAAAQTDSSYTTPDTAASDSTYPPEYIGGQDAMFNYIEDQLLLKLPPGEVIALQGETVSLSFRINKKGEVTYYRTINSTNAFITDYLRDIFLSMPKWKPGKQNGRFDSIKMEYQLKISLVDGGPEYNVQEDRYTYVADESSKPLKAVLLAVAAGLMLILFTQ
jgi:hypothetical protein